MGEGVLVEWVDENRLEAMGSVGPARHAHEGGGQARLVRRRGWRRGGRQAAWQVEVEAEGGRRAGAVGRAAGRHSRGAALRPGGRARLRAHRGVPACGAGARRGRDVPARRGVADLRGRERSAGRSGRGRGTDRGQRSRSRLFGGACARAQDQALRCRPRSRRRCVRTSVRAATWLVRLAHWGAGAILADEMGLGKTVQTLAVLAHRAPLGPALVVAPTSVVLELGRRGGALRARR